MTATLTDLALRVGTSNRIYDHDPLRAWRFGLQDKALDRIKQAFGLFTSATPIEELHLRAANKGTKTQTKAAYVIACLQKRPHLDGVKIPQWKGPVEALQLVLDYPQQLLSVKPAYLKLLGGWPHHARFQGEYLKSIHVMPWGGDPHDESAWSVIYFLTQKNWEAGTGARGDVIDFDEPPKIAVLDELRKAAHAGRRSVTIIGETPTKMSQWAALRADYGECPRSSLKRVDQERAECRWSLHEVADWVLSPEEKDALRRKYRRSAIPEAREHGDYVNAEGSSPWGVQGMQTLMAMLEAATDPAPKEFVAAKEGEGGRPVPLLKVKVDVFQKPREGRDYYMAVDPASGQDDGRHHELGLVVVEMGSGDLCARWSGYLAPFTLGTLAASVGKAYNTAAIDVEMQDRWGVNVIRGLRYANYGHIAHETREVGPRQFAKEEGFGMNKETKAAVIGSLQEWLDSTAAGMEYGHCPSRAVINSIMSMELDEKDNIVAGDGLAHGVDAVMFGRCLQKAVSRSTMETPDYVTEETLEQQVMGRALGLKRHEEFGPPDSDTWLEVGGG